MCTYAPSPNAFNQQIIHPNVVTFVFYSLDISAAAFLQIIFSRLKLLRTNTIVNNAHKIMKAKGIPQPIPNATLSAVVNTKTVETTAMHINPIPQNNASCSIIFLNNGEASYRAFIFSLYTFSPLASMAPQSSIYAYTAGLQVSPFGVEDMEKGSFHFNIVNMADEVKRIPW